MVNSSEVMVTQNLHATPVYYQTHESLISAVRDEDVTAALMDGNAAAYFIKKQNVEDVIIEREIELEMKVRMFLHYNKTALQCKEDEYEEDLYVDEMQSTLSTVIPPVKIQRTKVRILNGMFDGTDDGIIKIKSLVTVAL